LLRSLGASASLAPTLADVVADVGGWHPVRLRQFRWAILGFVFYPKFSRAQAFGLWGIGQGNFG
jgi:hypothetical protein